MAQFTERCAAETHYSAQNGLVESAENMYYSNSEAFVIIIVIVIFSDLFFSCSAQDRLLCQYDSIIQPKKLSSGTPFNLCPSTILT